MMRAMNPLEAAAAKNVGDIVRYAIKLAPGKKALVFFDQDTPLAKVIVAAYRAALPEALFLEYAVAGKDGFFGAIDGMTSGDLVVLVSSMTFRLDDFRVRIELFKRGMATIDHMHLERAEDERQIAIYVDSLAYDPSYYPRLGRALKEKIDRAETVKVICDGTVLAYEGGMETAKLNVGDYSDMANVGGTFPIGEVFSEPRDFERLNGEAMLFAFAGTDHFVQIHQPFKIRIERGVLVSHEGPPSFQQVLDQIAVDETIMVREFGLGLNPALGKHALLKDITAFERQKGLHFSLGEKHGVYKKPGLNPKKTHYHIDVFVDVRRIEMDGEAVYENGEFKA
jgi:aminopeptidase